MAQPQAIIQCRNHRFQPRELPGVPALKVFGARFHVAVRARHRKTVRSVESFVEFLTLLHSRSRCAKDLCGDLVDMFVIASVKSRRVAHGSVASSEARAALACSVRHQPKTQRRHTQKFNDFAVASPIGDLRQGRQQLRI